MKKIAALLLALLCAVGLAGCGASTTSNTAQEVDADYGTSTLFTTEDMNAAVKLIKDKFSTWEGCELHSLTYSSDDQCNEENLAWLNQQEDPNGETAGHEPYTQCMMFKSDFHTPKFDENGFESDTEYTDFQWWVARSDGGEWTLVCWGY